MEPLRCTSVETPIGVVVLATADGARVARIALPAPDGAPRPDPAWAQDTDVLRAPAAALAQWLAGERATLEMPLDRDAAPGTPFQEAVWAALEEIPQGTTTTYGALAASLGHAGAARAVGAACGANPLPIARACHRVVAADGLGGYAGGLAQKRFLLDRERLDAAS